MRKVLASIGIGNATVDTVLPDETVRPGDVVDAEVNVRGGDAEQEVGRITLEVETRYLTDDGGYREVDLARFAIAEGLPIEPGAEETRSVTLEIPYDTPVTIGRTDVWVETELEVPGVDPEDRDPLDVRPTSRLRAAFDAMDELGFSLRTADCEADPYGRYGSRRFVQEFEFRASGDRLRGAVDEVELVALPGPDALELFVEVDRRGGLLSEMAETDERTTRTTVATTDVDAVREELAALIERHS